MTDILGSFSLVLHAHLPWVIGHGVWPHGMDWRLVNSRNGLDQ